MVASSHEPPQLPQPARSILVSAPSPTCEGKVRGKGVSERSGGERWRGSPRRGVGSCVRACVRACVCACVRACVRACVCARSALIPHSPCRTNLRCRVHRVEGDCLLTPRRSWMIPRVSLRRGVLAMAGLRSVRWRAERSHYPQGGRAAVRELTSPPYRACSSATSIASHSLERE